MEQAHRFLACAVAGLIGATIPDSAGAAETCYQMPFSKVGDPWGSTCCGRTSPHRGVDFPQPAGTPIPAIAAGVVRLKPPSSCLGNVVVIEHGDGMFSGYSHMLSASPLAVGTPVSSGQIIGRVGNTGTCSMGAHLHLTLAPSLGGYAYGATVDPVAYIKSHTTCNRAPIGALDAANCEAITGWAQDPDVATAPIDVHLYFGGPAGDPKAHAFPVRADIHRGDLCTAIGSCRHGFSALAPLAFYDGVSRPVFAYGIDSKGGANPMLGTKSFRCDSAPIPLLPSGVVRRRVSNVEVLASWKFTSIDIATLAEATLDAIPVGPDLAPTPALVTVVGDPKIYLREYDTARTIPSPTVMSAWRFGALEVKPITTAELASKLPGADWLATPFLAKGNGADVYLIDAPPALWAQLLDDDVPARMAPGATTDVKFRFRNRGSLMWDAGSVQLAPTPRDKASSLCDPSWPSCTRAAAISSVVLSNGEATVSVRIKAPTEEGSITACFGLVTGAHWFSDPGANGPTDDALCRTIAISADANEPNSDLDPASGQDLEGACACRTSGAHRDRPVLVFAFGIGAMLGLARVRRSGRGQPSA